MEKKIYRAEPDEVDSMKEDMKRRMRRSQKGNTIKRNRNLQGDITKPHLRQFAEMENIRSPKNI